MKLFLLLTSIIFFSCSSTPIMGTTISNTSTTSIALETINPYSEVLEWHYKIENGKIYKRLYNNTTESWVGDWIYVGEAN